MFTATSLTPTTHQPAARFYPTFGELRVGAAGPAIKRDSSAVAQTRDKTVRTRDRSPRVRPPRPFQPSSNVSPRNEICAPRGTVTGSVYSSTKCKNPLFSRAISHLDVRQGTVPPTTHLTVPAASNQKTCVFPGKNALSRSQPAPREPSNGCRHPSWRPCFQTQNTPFSSGNTHITSIPC
jgi:hypothetical protein